MLPVAYLVDLSERQAEEMVNYHLPMKYFVGLAVNERAPDHTEKKHASRGVWVALKQSEGYREGLRERHKVQRKSS